MSRESAVNFSFEFAIFSDWNDKHVSPDPAAQPALALPLRRRPVPAYLLLVL